MLKAFRALTVGMMLLFLLAACGGGNGGTGTASAPATESAPAAASEAPMESMAAEESMAPMESEEASAEPSEAAESAAPEESEAAEASGDAGASEELIELPEVVAAEAQGPIVTAGSSTTFPVTQAVAERWQQEGGSSVTVDSIGTGAGFERFCVSAETDISNASRPINEEETEACIGNGREPIEFRVGTDALAIVVSSENDFLEELTTEQLAQIYSKEVTTWDQIDPSYPAEEIQLFSPGTDSGTFDYFVEVIFDEDAGPIQAAQPQFSEDDNILVQGVEGSPYAIAYFGYAYYQENEDRLKILTINGVEPTEETAEDNSYPLSRPLFIYSAASIIEEKPQVGAFINYYLQNLEEVIPEVGYFPASVEAQNEARQNLLDVIGE
jgi:phosphate transport system substrate-binding protein